MPISLWSLSFKESSAFFQCFIPRRPNLIGLHDAFFMLVGRRHLFVGGKSLIQRLWSILMKQSWICSCGLKVSYLGSLYNVSPPHFWIPPSPPLGRAGSLCHTFPVPVPVPSLCLLGPGGTGCSAGPLLPFRCNIKQSTFTLVLLSAVSALLGPWKEGPVCHYVVFSSALSSFPMC